MKKRVLSLSVICAALLSANEQKLDEIVVTVQRSEQSINDISKSISVVSKEKIEETMPSSVPSILASEPGIYFAPNSQQTGQVVIRGFSTQNNRAPLFIDGNRVRGRNTLEYMMVDPNQVERIEVARGPASSLYGTDSFGGIINVISKRASGDVFGDFAMSDSYISSQFSSVGKDSANRLQLGFVGHGFDALLGLNYKTGRDYNTPEGKIPNSNYLSRSFDFIGGYSFSHKHRVELQARYSHVNAGRAGGQFAAPGMASKQGVLRRYMTTDPITEKYLSLGYKGEIYDNTNLDLSLYRREYYTHMRIIPDANKNTYNDVYVIGPVVYGGRAILKHTGDKLDTTFGMDWYHQNKDSSEQSVNSGKRNITSPRATQLNIATFGLLEYNFDNGAILSGSLRYDYFNTSVKINELDENIKRIFDNLEGDIKNKKLTYGLGAIIPSGIENLSLIANLNSIFRAPTTDETANISTAVTNATYYSVPNPSLKPEAGMSYEIGLRYDNNAIKAELIGFLGEYKDLIISKNTGRKASDGKAINQLQNIGRSQIKGIEASLAMQITNELSAKTNIAYLRGKDKDSGANLPQIMPLFGYISLKYKPEFFANSFVEYSGNWEASRTKVDETQERKRAGYFVHNFYLGKELNNIAGFKKFNLNFGIENIFNKKYASPVVPEAINYPVSPTNPLLNPGRNFKIGFKANF